MDFFDLARPDHLHDANWVAIDTALMRLRAVWDGRDLPEVIGKAKELVETVAKVVIVSVDGAVSDSMKYQPLVKLAQAKLARQPGPDLAQDQHLLAIAQGAQTIATSLSPLRNSHGGGHGRARVPDVAEEMAAVSLEAALLWSRWALRRLGHQLADYPNDLIDAVQSPITRRPLRDKFKAAALPQQPDDVQHRIGVAFGQQSAGGFANATEVGVDPVLDGGFETFPPAYRRGLLEGMLLNSAGEVGMAEWYVPTFVSLVASLPDDDIAALLTDLSGKVDGASWTPLWRGTTEITPAYVLSALRSEASRLPLVSQSAFEALSAVLERDAESQAD